MASNNRELIIIVIFICIFWIHKKPFCELLNRGLVSLVDVFVLKSRENPILHLKKKTTKEHSYALERFFILNTTRNIKFL